MDFFYNRNFKYYGDKKMNEIKAAIFDMDGTILNTLVDLKDATNYGLSKNNLPERSLEEIRQFVGNGIKSLIAKAVPENTSAEIYQKVYEDFTEFYKIHNSDNTCPYKGIKDAIKKIRESGIKTAVVSNKPDYGVQALVKKFFDGLFDVSIGEREGVNKKPAPDMVNLALNALNVPKTNAVYIGDSDVDFNTAANSELKFIGVAWGFKGHDFLKELGSKFVVDTADELTKLIISK